MTPVFFEEGKASISRGGSLDSAVMWEKLAFFDLASDGSGGRMNAGGPEAFPLLEVELASGARLDGPGSSMLTSSVAILTSFTMMQLEYRNGLNVERTQVEST